MIGRNIPVIIDKIERKDYANITSVDLIFALSSYGSEYINFNRPENQEIINEIVIELHSRISSHPKKSNMKIAEAMKIIHAEIKNANDNSTLVNDVEQVNKAMFKIAELIEGIKKFTDGMKERFPSNDWEF